MSIRYSLLLGVSIVILSCTEPPGGAVNIFSDTAFVKIADFKDRRLTDSLKAFLDGESEYPGYDEQIRQALLAFGSVQDTAAIGTLNSFTHLSDRTLAYAAAFALGQMGNQGKKILATEPKPGGSATAYDEGYRHLGRFLIESGIHPDDSNDTKTIPWAYYRYGVNAKVGDVEALKVKRFLTDKDSSARLGAAHFYARTNALDSASPGVRSSIQKILVTLDDKDPEIRMAAVHALRKCVNDSSFTFLTEKGITDPDYRVRVNAVRALQSFPSGETKDILIRLLDDEQVNVGITASEVIKAVITKDVWKEIAAVAKRTKNWRMQANLYEAALAMSDDKELAEEIAAIVKRSVNPYQKAALLTALQHSVMSVGFIAETLRKADVPVVRSAAANALVQINYRKNFDPSLKKRFADIYREALRVGDVAVTATVADALADSVLGYRDVISDIFFLQEAKQKLSFPRDREAIRSIDLAAAYFGRRKNLPAEQQDVDHPIDWKLVKRIPRDQRAVIKTTKGDITIRLFVEEAPGTVANFVKLVTQHYYDNKFFHRVVPNFVIQTGCYRGDGWGNENYTIRSEFSPRRYTTGVVGMASAGKDTESTQWFITHSPTPHLEGRYTLFGYVESGMEVVHRIEVGDQVLNIEMSK
jgi:cyclophilin family peptidyl-prolyl cis-trans isomerase/HEAT repeat protein